MNTTLPTDPKAIAQASAEHMYARDNATQGLGIQLMDVGPGYARMHTCARRLPELWP